MSFLSEDSLVSKETSTTASQTAKDHSRPPRADEPTHKGKNRMLYCKYCASYGAQNTSNFKQHLFSKHGIVLGASRAVDSLSSLTLQNIYNQASVTSQNSELDTQILKKALNKEVITEAIITLIVVHSLSFRLVESSEFHALCKALNPTASNEIISSHSGIKNQIEKSWLSHKDLVRKRLQSSLSTIHISLDVWTSPNRKLFLGICAQFVDRETERLSKALIGLPSISSHHADSQCEALFSVLEDYGIHQKLGAIISDNASSNDKLCRLLGSILEEGGSTYYPCHDPKGREDHGRS
jgi:hypothetical protein